MPCTWIVTRVTLVSFVVSSTASEPVNFSISRPMIRLQSACLVIISGIFPIWLVNCLLDCWKLRRRQKIWGKWSSVLQDDAQHLHILSCTRCWIILLIIVVCMCMLHLRCSVDGGSMYIWHVGQGDVQSCDKMFFHETGGPAHRRFNQDFFFIFLQNPACV